MKNVYKEVQKLDELSRDAYKSITVSYAKRIRVYIEKIEQNGDSLNTIKTLTADMGALKDTATLFIKSLLLGMECSTERKEFADGDEDRLDLLPFEEALDYMEKKLPVDRDTYYALSDRLKFRAFTVSRMADGDMVERVKKQLVRSLENGESLRDFLKFTDEELLNGVGLGKGGGWYWETVYRTNVQTAYNTGRAIGFAAVPPLALELVGIGDERQSPICRSLTQPPVRLPYGDTFWQTHWPPFHFNCRTTVRAIYDESELDEGEYNKSPVGTEKAAQRFGTYPLENDSWWEELKDQKKRAVKYGVQKEIEEAKKRLGTESGTRFKNANKEFMTLLAKTDKTESELCDIGETVLNQAKKEQKEIFTVMKEYRQFGSDKTHSFKKGSSSFAKAEIIKAMQFYPKDWIEKSAAASLEKQLFAKKTSRGYYDRLNVIISIDSQTYKGKNTTAIHEMAHRFESLCPEIIKAEKQFYERRTSGEALQSLKVVTGHNYGINEMTKQDKFLHPYMGKDYKGNAYEILSMGLEYFVNPLDNKNDNDLNAFIIGVLLGV